MRYLLASAALLAATAAAGAPPTLYEGAQVWTPSGFQARDLAVADGRVVAREALPADARRVSLAGRFVTPAYANAHAHVTGATEQASRVFTDAGVYYVLNTNTIVIGPEARGWYGQPGRYSVKVAQGGITEPGGHPERLYVDGLGPRIYGGRPRDWFVGNAFHYGTTPAEIDAALNLLKAHGAELVKIYLLHSEAYLRRRNDHAAYGMKGLNPVNVPYLVTRAHALGLPVIAHLETAHDLRMAALAGVDMAAHVPGYGEHAADDLEAVRITPELAGLVARSGMRVVPTYALAAGGDQAGPALTPRQQSVVAVQADNLRMLRAAGVELLIGTDGFNQIFTEAEHLAIRTAVPIPEVLTAVFTTGARIFPERRIGCFEAGCEADFLVLTADPSADIRALRSIERRVMAGEELPAAVPDPEPAAPATR